VSLLREGNTCVFGLQWGDEGKGKIVDLLTEEADVVVRYCGGANAGHTVRFNGQRYSTHLLPVGIFRPHVMNIIGNGVVIDPEALFREIDEFLAKGFAVSPANLRISYKAHVVMPYHMAEDVAREASTGSMTIGTTKRGIGPTYADKMQRSTALRVSDLLHEENLKRRIAQILEERNKHFRALYDLPPLDWKPIFEAYRDYGRRMTPYVDDSTTLILQAAKESRKIVFEGAHAVLLDVDHGTYPYVTSSNCSALGLFTGAGVPPSICKNYVGIVKSYSTRVGGGPFPTEQDNATGQYIRERGDEYGSTTRRPRRCGWYDAMVVKYSVDLCGVTEIVLTLLDVLTGLDRVQICTGYQYHGSTVDHFRADVDMLAEVVPVYESLPGWRGNISGCRTFTELPKECQNYVKRIEQLAGAPVKAVSVGADRGATLFR
jgi:adenylosuccinate synthase